MFLRSFIHQEQCPDSELWCVCVVVVVATVSSREDLGVSPHDACKQSSVLFYQQEGNFVGLICDFKGSAFHSLYLKNVQEPP